MSVRYRTIGQRLLRPGPTVEVLHGKIALAGCVFQAGAIQNGDGAPDILDQPVALQNSRREAHTRASESLTSGPGIRGSLKAFPSRSGPGT